MQRTIARLPESVHELCLLKVGLQVRRLGAFFFARRIGKAIDRSAKEAKEADVGLLASEQFLINPTHFGVLQYWRTFEEMEAWTHRPPHADWWKDAAERQRTKGDFGIYHETFLVPRDRIEAIYLNCLPTGIALFGLTGEAVGPDTNSRGRLRMGPRSGSGPKTGTERP